jgi:hypothetical protein
VFEAPGVEPVFVGRDGLWTMADHGVLPNELTSCSVPALAQKLGLDAKWPFVV